MLDAAPVVFYNPKVLVAKPSEFGFEARPLATLYRPKSKVVELAVVAFVVEII